MKRNINKILGTIMMIVSVLAHMGGIVSQRITQAKIEAAYASSGNIRDTIPITDETPGLMVILLFIIGFVLLAAGFPSSIKSTPKKELKEEKKLKEEEELNEEKEVKEVI